MTIQIILLTQILGSYGDATNTPLPIIVYAGASVPLLLLQLAMDLVAENTCIMLTE